MFAIIKYFETRIGFNIQRIILFHTLHNIILVCFIIIIFGYFNITINTKRCDLSMCTPGLLTVSNCFLKRLYVYFHSSKPSIPYSPQISLQQNNFRNILIYYYIFTFRFNLKTTNFLKRNTQLPVNDGCSSIFSIFLVLLDLHLKHA